MSRVARACMLAGSLLFAVSDSRAAPAPKPGGSSRASKGLESADPAVRRDAITKLVADRDPTAVAQLALALEGDDDEGVRQAAASGLGELADRRGVGPLRRCLQIEPSQAVKRSCRVSLGRLDPEAATKEPEPSAAPGGAGAPAATPSAPAAIPGTPAAMPGTSTAVGGAQPASTAVDLRIEVTAQDAAERPNHAYIELWSAIDKSTLALGYERVLGAHWSVALEPSFSAESASAGTVKASAVGVGLAVRPHFYFLQQAPSGPYVAPFAAAGYVRATLESGSQTEKLKGTGWSIGAGVGWSLVINARAIFKLSAIFSYSKAGATASTSGLESSASSASFNPFFSAGIML